EGWRWTEGPAFQVGGPAGERRGRAAGWLVAAAKSATRLNRKRPAAVARANDHKGGNQEARAQQDPEYAPVPRHEARHGGDPQGRSQQPHIEQGGDLDLDRSETERNR